MEIENAEGQHFVVGFVNNAVCIDYVFNHKWWVNGKGLRFDAKNMRKGSDGDVIEIELDLVDCIEMRCDGIWPELVVTHTIQRQSYFI